MRLRDTAEPWRHRAARQRPPPGGGRPASQPGWLVEAPTGAAAVRHRRRRPDPAPVSGRSGSATLRARSHDRRPPPARRPHPRLVACRSEVRGCSARSSAAISVDRHHPLLRPPAAPPPVDRRRRASRPTATGVHEPPDPTCSPTRSAARSGAAARRSFRRSPSTAPSSSLLELHRPRPRRRDSARPGLRGQPDGARPPRGLPRALRAGSPSWHPGPPSCWPRCDELDLQPRHDAARVEAAEPARDHRCIIVSASGMASGGRVVHHLRISFRTLATPSS